jgi:hypothetical protein
MLLMLQEQTYCGPYLCSCRMAYTVEAEADDASTTTFGFNLALVEPWRTQVWSGFQTL